MAKALTRQQSRRSKTPDARERELKRMRLSVCDDVGFRLYLATYDQPKRRDELIAWVIKEAEAEKVRVTRLDLAEAGPETNLVGLLGAHLQKTDLPPGWRQAVMVTGIEQRLDYSAGPKGFAFLRQANLLRDALPEAAPVPVVLWLSRMASAALPAEAPDLWHWRAANFDFTGDLAPRVEVLRELITLRSEDDLGLSGEQRRVRFRMLEDLLAELEREGPPRSKRRKAERADLLLELGIEDWHLGRAAEAIPRFERALRIFHEIGDRQGEGQAHGNLGNAYADLDEMERALEHYEQHLKIACEIGDRRSEGQALGSLGSAYFRMIERERAIEYHEQALTLAREIGDRQGEDLALKSLGSTYLLLFQPRRAIEYFEQSLAIAPEGSALEGLGVAYLILGEPRRAIEYYDQRLAIAREIRDPGGEGDSLYHSALAFDQLGERGEAIRRMEEALRIYEEIESPKAARAREKLAEWRGEGGR